MGRSERGNADQAAGLSEMVSRRRERVGPPRDESRDKPKPMGWWASFVAGLKEWMASRYEEPRDVDRWRHED